MGPQPGGLFPEGPQRKVVQSPLWPGAMPSSSGKVVECQCLPIPPRIGRPPKEPKAAANKEGSPDQPSGLFPEVGPDQRVHAPQGPLKTLGNIRSAVGRAVVYGILNEDKPQPKDWCSPCIARRGGESPTVHPVSPGGAMGADACMRAHGAAKIGPEGHQERPTWPHDLGPAMHTCHM